jgi:hypothetical protein
MAKLNYITLTKENLKELIDGYNYIMHNWHNIDPENHRITLTGIGDITIQNLISDLNGPVEVNEFRKRDPSVNFQLMHFIIKLDNNQKCYDVHLATLYDGYDVILHRGMIVRLDFGEVEYKQVTRYEWCYK